jgi:hypothetical protein
MFGGHWEVDEEIVGTDECFQRFGQVFDAGDLSLYEFEGPDFMESGFMEDVQIEVAI